MSLPLYVVSGFLGSGKTTLLNRLLRHESLKNALVLMNEFGEVGLDHLLLERLDEETVLLKSGCICCSLREDLLSSLEGVLEQRRSGSLTSIECVILETTGLADPAPIAATLGPHGPLHGSFHFDGLLVTVDALHGRQQLRSHAEARAQVALADRIFVTKLDLAPSKRAPLLDELRRLNPRAATVTDIDGLNPLDLLCAGVIRRGGKSLDVAFWLAPVPESQRFSLLQAHSHKHADIRSFVINIPGEVDFGSFSLWISLFTQMNGDRVLRIKGLLSLPGQDGYLVFHSIRSFVHSPTRVPAKEGAPRLSIVVFIVQNFEDQEESAVRRAIESCALGAVSDSTKAPQ